MRKFAGETFVIKYGGNAMGEVNLAQQFAEDVVMLKQVGINPIIVHGGGPQISLMLDKLKIQSEFVGGLRVTDAATVEIVEMVLSGNINKEIVSWINHAGGLISARKLRRTIKDPDSNIEKILDLGFVGEPAKIDPQVLIALEESDIIPVIAPIGMGENGETYNINADTCAGAIASALAASKLLMLTDVPGIMDKNKKLINKASLAEAKAMMTDGTISGGMIPKIETCISAVENNVEAAHILDGRVPHVLLLEIFTKHGTGTMIY